MFVNLHTCKKRSADMCLDDFYLPTMQFPNFEMQQNCLFHQATKQIFDFLSFYSTFTVSVLTSPVNAITSISTDAPSGSLPAWKHVRTG